MGRGSAQSIGDAPQKKVGPSIQTGPGIARSQVCARRPALRKVRENAPYNRIKKGRTPESARLLIRFAPNRAGIWPVPRLAGESYSDGRRTRPSVPATAGTSRGFGSATMAGPYRDWRFAMQSTPRSPILKARPLRPQPPAAVMPEELLSGLPSVARAVAEMLLRRDPESAHRYIAQLQASNRNTLY